MSSHSKRWEKGVLKTTTHLLNQKTTNQIHHQSAQKKKKLAELRARIARHNYKMSQDEREMNIREKARVKKVDTKLRDRLKGKILLQVESKGEAWYIYNGKRYYMKNDHQAYQIMRFLSLGITNNDLAKIEVGEFE